MSLLSFGTSLACTQKGVRKVTTGPPPPQVLNGVLDRDRGFFPLWCLVALLIFEIVDDKSKSLRHCVFPGGHPSKY